MRKIALVFLPLALSACGPLNLNSAPVPASAANQTVVDEKVALGVETIYKGWAASINTGLDLGLIKGGTAARVQELDKQIYAAVLVARSAYDAGNARSYAEAAAQVADLVSQGTRLIKGE